MKSHKWKFTTQSTSNVQMLEINNFLSNSECCLLDLYAQQWTKSCWAIVASSSLPGTSLTNMTVSMCIIEHRLQPVIICPVTSLYSLQLLPKFKPLIKRTTYDLEAHKTWNIIITTNWTYETISSIDTIQIVLFIKIQNASFWTKKI